jgi:hypothetical protein
MSKTLRWTPARMLAVLTLTLVTATSLVSGGCSRKKVSLEYDPSPENLLVELKTTGGIPTPWVDGIPDFRLYGDGRVVARPGRNARVPVVEGRLAPEQVRDLLSKIEETGYFELGPEYADRKVMDGVTERLTVNLKDQKKEVRVYMKDVKAFDKASAVVMGYPLSDSREYVPATGYLYVQKNQGGEGSASSQPAPPEVLSLLPPQAELLKAAETRKPLAIDGQAMVSIMKYESGQKYLGLDAQVDGTSVRLFPLYEPTVL